LLSNFVHYLSSLYLSISPPLSFRNEDIHEMQALQQGMKVITPEDGIEVAKRVGAFAYTECSCLTQVGVKAGIHSFIHSLLLSFSLSSLLLSFSFSVLLLSFSFSVLLLSFSLSSLLSFSFSVLLLSFSLSVLLLSSTPSLLLLLCSPSSYLPFFQVGLTGGITFPALSFSPPSPLFPSFLIFLLFLFK
jgi:hypothetical protein